MSNCKHLTDQPGGTTVVVGCLECGETYRANLIHPGTRSRGAALSVQRVPTDQSFYVLARLGTVLSQKGLITRDDWEAAIDGSRAGLPADPPGTHYSQGRPILDADE